jgi:acetolactate decarboxylase
MKHFFISTLTLVALCITSIGNSPATAAEVVYQISTIDALLSGLYDGAISIKTLKTHGDLGIGTFDGLDGEMVVVDGQVFRVSADGHAAVVADEETTPFASITDFVSDQQLQLPAGTNLDSLKALINPAGLSPNLFHAFRMEGSFNMVATRSVPRQTKPYAPLVEVVKSQPLFNFENVTGVMVGFYCPPYVKGVNVPGYHLHFLTADRSAGGHVLSFTTNQVKLDIDTLPRLTLQLPTSAEFAQIDLQRDRQQELKKVEK